MNAVTLPDDVVAPPPEFTPFDRAALASLIGTVKAPVPVAAEIGSWLGLGSTQTFIDYLCRRGGQLLCVDTWKGSPGVEHHAEWAGRLDPYDTFMANTARARDFIRAARLPSLEAVQRLPDAYFDLVFIDADHHYESVKADIEAWRPKVKRGGILCGHDCEIRVTPRDVAALRAAKGEDAIPWPNKVADVVHPGVSLALHEIFKGRAKLFAEEIITLPSGQPGRSTVWWVRVP